MSGVASRLALVLHAVPGLLAMTLAVRAGE